MTHTTWVSLYQNVSILDVIEAKDDGSGCDSGNCKMCNASVKSSPPTNQHPPFYRPDDLQMLNQQCQSPEGKF